MTAPQLPAGVPELSAEEMDALAPSMYRSPSGLSAVYALGAQRAAEAQSAELSRLQAEVEALRADAERYRWLRSGIRRRQGVELANSGGGRSIKRDELRCLMAFDYWCPPSDLDAAITAAIAASKEQ